MRLRKKFADQDIEMKFSLHVVLQYGQDYNPAIFIRKMIYQIQNRK